MNSQVGVDNRYWLRRSDMMYYKYIDVLVKAFAYDATNIIDIGSANTRYIESFHWIPNKYTLDIVNPYESPNVTAIEADFLKFNPKNKFDFVTCLQVLEHIPNVEEFAKKLFDTSDKVLISVPYLWPEDAEEEHINDPVDEEKLKQWTGREPSYSIIVSEPLRNPRKGISKRLICYYDLTESKIDYGKALKNVKEINVENGSDSPLDLINENKQMYEEVKLELTKVVDSQKTHYELMKEELMLFKLEKELNDLVNKNKEMELKNNELKRNLNRYKSKTPRIINERKYYEKEYNKLINSTSWNSTKPIRKTGELLKGIFR